MKICDFRLRPPAGDFLKTAQYDLARNAKVTRQFGMYQAASTTQLSMELFLQEMDASGIVMGVLTGRVSKLFGNVSCARYYKATPANLRRLPVWIFWILRKQAPLSKKKLCMARSPA